MIATRMRQTEVSGDTDPNFANVSLLLHMNGTNGSTTFVDSGPNALAVTASGNAQISTAQSKFGGAAGAFDGNGDYLTVSGSESSALFDFGSGDFTIEGWVYPLNNTLITFAAKRAAAQASGWLVSPTEFSAHVGGAWRQSVITANQPTLSTWTHVAFTRSGNDFRLFHNGVQVGSTYTQSGVLQNQTLLPLRIGVAGGTSEIFSNAYIDDLRITKGVARYTANFTAPTAAFPDS